MREIIDREILFLRDQIEVLERMDRAIKRQVLHMEARIDDLHKIAYPPPAREG